MTFRDSVTKHNNESRHYLPTQGNIKMLNLLLKSIWGDSDNTWSLFLAQQLIKQVECELQHCQGC